MSNKPRYVTENELTHLLNCHGAVQGPPGCDGKDGDDGREGPRGPMGPRGEQGKQGCPGVQGNQGVRGERGLDGRNGCDGKDGRDGRDGDTGPVGPVGPKGCDGKDGKDGRDGPCGEEGSTGSQGPQGEKGDKGEQGERGLQGEQGVKGDTGERGPEGPQGIQGEQGLDGDKGDRGDTGATGPQGLPGARGADGAPGTTVECEVQGNTLTISTIDPVTQTQNDCVLDASNGVGTDTNFYLTSANCGVVQQPNTVDANVDIVLTVPGAGEVVLNLEGSKLWELFSAFESVGNGGGLTEAQVNALIDQRLANVGGLTEAQVNSLISQQVSVVENVQESTLPSGQVNYTLIQSNGPDIQWSSAVPGNASGTSEVTWQVQTDPNNSCVQQVVFTSTDPAQEDCVLYPYDEPVCQKCYCLTVSAGQTVAVQGSSNNGFQVLWGENGQSEEILAGTNQGTAYTYNEAGVYELRLIQNEFCDDVTDLDIDVGAGTLEPKACDGCQ